MSSHTRKNSGQSTIIQSQITRRDFIRVTGTGALALSSGMIFSAGKAYPAGSDRKIRLAVVGGGFGSMFYWHEHPNCEVTAVTDLRSNRRDHLRKVYQCDSVYDSLEEMLVQADNIDAVAIFTGATDHVKHAVMCLNQGLHVVSACPACFSLEEAELLRATVERTGLTYMMAETSYYTQEGIFARELFQKGILGNLFYSELEYYHDRGDLDRLVTDKKSRFYLPDGSHSWRWGLPPMHYPTHALGNLIGVTKERIVSVSCQGWGTRDHTWLTDNAYDNPFWNEASIMQTNKGNMCRCNVFWLCAAEGERAQLMGDKATFLMDKRGIHEPKLLYRTAGDTPTMYDLPVQDGGDVDVPVYWNTDMLPEAMRHNSYHGGSHTFISAEFINSLIEERPPAIDIYESLAMTVPGIVAHQSALKNGEQLAIPQFDRD